MTASSAGDVKALAREWLVRFEASNWETMDLEAGYARCAADIEISLNGGPILAKGIDALRELDSMMLGGIEGYRVEISNIASENGTVFIERIDHITRSGISGSFPGCGVFEFNADGLLTSIRDYFDPAAFAGFPGPPLPAGHSEPSGHQLDALRGSSGEVSPPA